MDVPGLDGKRSASLLGGLAQAETELDLLRLSDEFDDELLEAGLGRYQ